MNNTTFENSNSVEVMISIPLVPGVALFFITVLVTSTLVLWRKYWDKLQPTHIFELSVLTEVMLAGLYTLGTAILQANNFEEPYIVRCGGRFISLSLRWPTNKMDKQIF